MNAEQINKMVREELWREDHPEFEDFEEYPHCTNLYKRDGKWYKLAANGISPNGCWLLCPKMVQVLDMETATGKLIYGSESFQLQTGSVSAGHSYLTI